MKQNHWKIGEIHITQADEINEPDKCTLAFAFNENLKADIDREGNEDLKDRIINVLATLHDVFLELQNRVINEENGYVTCPQCGCKEEKELMTTCTVCGEEYCTMCESVETPEVCEICEKDIENGEDN